MPDRIAAALRELDRRKADYDRDSGRRKRELLRLLDMRRLRRAKDVERLHDALCFLRAYPDDAALLTQVERMLSAFARRGDLRRHRRALADSGIAGTSIYFPFFAPSSTWLARYCGPQLSIDWADFDRRDDLDPLLLLLALGCEEPGLDEFDFGVRGWIRRLKGSGETDAAFLLRRLEQLPLSYYLRDMLLNRLDIPFRLSPGPKTPARTREKYSGVPITYQTGPLSHARPTVSAVVAQPPVSIRDLSPREGQKLIELARSAMAVRRRDLEAFAYGDRHDVRLVDCGGGLQFAYIGLMPERRLLLETVYGFLMLKNGVPVGYGVNAALFGSSEVAYTVFDTFRAGEAAMMFARALAIARHMFGSDTFMIDPYQIGEDNDDALRSGAWWFYQKLGFRPREAELLRIMRRDLKRMKADRAYRSSIGTLKELATASVFLHLDKRRDDVLGVLPLAKVGLRVTGYLAERFGYDRKQATKTCSQEAMRLIGKRSLRGLSRVERRAWDRWSPLIMILPGLKRWRPDDKRALFEVVQAKGGRRESDYLLRFERHKRLRQSIRSVAESE